LTFGLEIRNTFLKNTETLMTGRKTGDVQRRIVVWSAIKYCGARWQNFVDVAWKE